MRYEGVFVLIKLDSRLVYLVLSNFSSLKGVFNKTFLAIQLKRIEFKKPFKTKKKKKMVKKSCSVSHEEKQVKSKNNILIT